MSKAVELTKEAAVWTLAIQRPESLNALNSQVFDELEAVLTSLTKESFDNCKVLIVTGQGEKAFVAGADIKEINSLNEVAGHKFAERGQNVFRTFENLKIPVIAAVNGFALGGGLELALSCDFIIASENARFGLPEVSLGLIPGFGGTVRLSRVVGLAKAKEMIFSGDMIKSDEALRIGLVNKVVPQSELLAEAKKIAVTIASRAPVAISHAKESIMRSFDQDIDTAMKTEALEFSKLFTTADVKEGTQAFIEKRKPAFKGR